VVRRVGRVLELLGKNQPCLSASSFAIFTIPEARSAAGLRITFAPSPLHQLQPLHENDSAMMATETDSP